MNTEPIREQSPHIVSRPLMRQSWTDLTFLHWRFDPAVVRPLVPTGLELDLYEGVAWVGLVPFIVKDLTLPKAPSVPWVSTFAETNVRTYVTDAKGRRGVWFFSLEAARLLAVIGARVGYALPYFWARMKVETDGHQVRYQSQRHLGLKGRSEIWVEIGEKIKHPFELEVFLTARFRLYAQRGKTLLKADVEHAPWKLKQCRVKKLKETLIEAAGLVSPMGEPLAHYGGRVDVLVGAPKGIA